jgi:hypothetical protein
MVKTRDRVWDFAGVVLAGVVLLLTVTALLAVIYWWLFDKLPWYVDEAQRTISVAFVCWVFYEWVRTLRARRRLVEIGTNSLRATAIRRQKTEALRDGGWELRGDGLWQQTGRPGDPDREALVFEDAYECLKLEHGP